MDNFRKLIVLTFMLFSTVSIEWLLSQVECGFRVVRLQRMENMLPLSVVYELHGKEVM